MCTSDPVLMEINHQQSSSLMGSNPIVEDPNPASDMQTTKIKPFRAILSPHSTILATPLRHTAKTSSAFAERPLSRGLVARSEINHLSHTNALTSTHQNPCKAQTEHLFKGSQRQTHQGTRSHRRSPIPHRPSSPRPRPEHRTGPRTR